MDETPQEWDRAETGSGDGDTQEPSEPLPPPGDGAESYGAAVTQIFKSDHAIRTALSEGLNDRSSRSLLLRAAAEDAFATFTASRYTRVDRERSTYLTPADDLSNLLGEVMRQGLQAHRDAPEAGRLRLHLTPGVLARLDTTDASEDRLGRIPLRDLVALASGTAPLPPADPIAPCRAEKQADEILDAITSSPSNSPTGDGTATFLAGASDPSDTDGTAEPLVHDKIEELIESMRTPESPVAFNVAPRADMRDLQRSIATFELRSGPSDVTSYHDFTSLRIAFEGVWTELFDAQLGTLGRQLFEESVKLKSFAGVDPATDSVETLDDLKRLIDEVRGLAQITIEATPGTLRAGGDSAAGAVSQATTAVDIAKGVLLGGPTGDKTVDTILNPGGAVIEAIGNLLAGKPQLTWDSFPGPLPVAHDVITVRFEPDVVPAGTVEIVIENGPQAWWWKGIEFREFDTRGTVVSDFRISNDPRDSGVWDSTSFNRLPLYTTQLANGVLEFQKAAPGIGVGIHTGYYLLADLPARITDRMRVTFRWEKDS
jgi:hypothetical protein